MPLYSALGENLLATLFPVLSCPHSREMLRDMAIQERCWRPTKGGPGFRDPVLQGGTAKLGCLHHLMKRRCRGDLIAVYNYPKESCRGGGAKLSSVNPDDTAWDNSH